LYYGDDPKTKPMDRSETIHRRTYRTLLRARSIETARKRALLRRHYRGVPRGHHRAASRIDLGEGLQDGKEIPCGPGDVPGPWSLRGVPRCSHNYRIQRIPRRTKAFPPCVPGGSASAWCVSRSNRPWGQRRLGGRSARVQPNCCSPASGGVARGGLNWSGYPSGGLNSPGCIECGP
jgi:hypothetical protein